jgi:hypothetical protein
MKKTNSPEPAECRQKKKTSAGETTGFGFGNRKVFDLQTFKRLSKLPAVSTAIVQYGKNLSPIRGKYTHPGS